MKNIADKVSWKVYGEVRWKVSEKVDAKVEKNVLGKVREKMRASKVINDQLNRRK